MNTFLLYALIYLGAAVVAVPIASRLGLGAVLGYLAAGAAIGPHALGWVGIENATVASISEFGVVMMLFLVGLELRPRLLWKMRGQLLGLGGLQVLLTAGAIAVIGAAMGLGARMPIAAGLILAMSSTAIVLQSLQERGLLKTPAGQASFAVLLFQDISVIPILAVLPLLAAATGAPHAAAPAEHTNLIGNLPAWAQTLVVLAAMASIVGLGRYLVNPLFRAIARIKLRELFTAAALLLVVSVALAMHLLGLSPALGAFLAGVVLADSAFRHELEADIEPFKGLLLSLFFISVGAGIDFPLIGRQPLLIAGLVVTLIAVKAGVLFGLARVFKLSRPDSLLFALALAQGGEFAFVLLSFVVEHGVMTGAQASPLVAAVALSMAVTPLLFLVYEKVLAPRWHSDGPAGKPDDTIDSAEHAVIIAGFGRFGHIVGRMLNVNGYETTVLDHDPEQVETIRRLGLKVFYGDATRLELLHAAGAARARIFVVAIDDEERSIALVGILRQHFPHLNIFARAASRVHAYRLLRAGVTQIYRETLDSSLAMSVDTLRALGVRGYEAVRAARRFRAHDERAVRALADFWDRDDQVYFNEARRHVSALEQAFAADRARLPDSGDDGWDPPETRADAQKKAASAS